MGTATFIKRCDGNGDGRVYRVDPPMSSGWGGEEVGPYEHVWVSAVTAYGEPETWIFGCDESGDVLDWGELPGSLRGSLDHAEALRRAGYEVAS